MKTADVIHGDYSPGPFRDAAKAFFMDHISATTYDRLLQKSYWEETLPVAARLFLSEEDWNKFVLIEHFGKL